MNKNQILTNIAKKHCLVETLERRGSDSLDFHDIHVKGLSTALSEAFEAGRRCRKTIKKSNNCVSNFDPSDEIYWK